MLQIERTVGGSHTGPGRVAALGALVDFMQDCSCFQLDSEKELTAYFTAHNITMFLLSRQLRIHKLPRYGDHLLVRSSIYGLKRSHGYRNTMIYSDEEELLVASYATGAFVQLPEARLTIMPKEIIDTTRLDPKYEGMSYLPRKISLPPEGGIPCGEMPVYRYYIDENNHMNNARYFDVASEWVPDGFSYQTCRIEYKAAAKAGDIIIPVRYQPEPQRLILSLKSRAGETYANLEFIGS